jgi:hypothetical protein
MSGRVLVDLDAVAPASRWDWYAIALQGVSEGVLADAGFGPDLLSAPIRVRLPTDDQVPSADVHGGARAADLTVLPVSGRGFTPARA